MKHPASVGMNVKDDYTWRSNGHNRTNNPLLPGNVCVLIIGKSNGGKTTLLLNLLLQPEWLDYNQLYVFGRSLHQQEYQILKKGFEKWAEYEASGKHISTPKCIIYCESITTTSHR